MMRRLLATSLCLSLLAACSGSDPGPEVTVERGWMREPVPGTMMTAAYLEVINNTEATLVIDGVSSPQFGNASLHTTQMQDGRMQMRPLESLRIDPGARAVLKPGADHIMLGAPRVALDGIDRVELTLTGAGDPLVTVAVPVSRTDPWPEMP